MMNAIKTWACNEFKQGIHILKSVEGWLNFKAVCVKIKVMCWLELIHLFHMLILLT